MPSFHRILPIAAVFMMSIALPTQAADRTLDIEAHRGGRALRPENTLQSFANALSMGVDTLELDMGVTKDGAIVVSHDRWLSPDLARDTKGVYVAPPGTPYVQLTLAQVKAYDVGVIRPGSEYAKQFPDQLAVPGTPIPTLAEVFALVRKSGNTHVRLNIETKLNPLIPNDAPDPDRSTGGPCNWFSNGRHRFPLSI
jgi:glycerophosphoryl diester phosphodiesterase